MLLIIAEIWPGGDPHDKFVVGQMRIANQSDLAPTSNYSVKMYETGDRRIGVESWDARFTVHDHKRTDGVWTLVRSALDQALSKAADEKGSTKEGQTDV